MRFAIALVAVANVGGISLPANAEVKECDVRDWPVVAALTVGDSFADIAGRLHSSDLKWWVKWNGKAIDLAENEAPPKLGQLQIYVIRPTVPWFERWFSLVRSDQIVVIAFDEGRSMSGVACHIVLVGP